MTSSATVIVVGNLGKAPELTFTPTGTPVAKFSVAVNVKVKDTEITNWYNVTVFGKQGENATAYLSKGSSVQVIGDLVERPYEGRNGKGVSLDVTALSVRYLDAKPKDADDDVGDIDAEIDG